MTDRSQNGYPIIGTDLTKLYKVTDSGLMVRLRKGWTGWMLADLAKFIDKNIENLDRQKDDWGWAPKRPVRGYTDVFSNHCSGTAIDLNATQHPLGVAGTWSPEQITRINNKLKQYEGCIGWGENYTRRKDGMHFEIQRNLTAVTRVARKIVIKRRLGFASAK